MNKQLDLLLSKHLTRLGYPKEQWPEAKQKLLQYSQDVLTIESDGNYQSANKKSSAKGGYQFLNNSIAPALVRLKRYIEPQDWMDKVGKNKDARTITPQQQELLFFGDILEKTVKKRKGLGDTYIKGIIAGDKKSAFNLYTEGHHTRPDARTNVRANQQFGATDRFNIGDVRRTDIGKQDKYKPEEKKLGLVDAPRTDIGVPLKAPVEPPPIIPFGGIKNLPAKAPVKTPARITAIPPTVETSTDSMLPIPSGRLTPSQQNYYNMIEESKRFKEGGAVKQAQGLAALGRGEDTQLIHMTPSEIQGLNTLAQEFGGSLTTNPDTGLPEAGFLSNIMPFLIGGGLALATGGTSLAWANPWTIGGAMGLGGLAASGGDWKQAAKWGLGGLGGASIASSFATAGAGTAAGTTAGGAEGVKEFGKRGFAEAARLNTGNVGRALSTEGFKTLAADPAIKRGLISGAVGLAAGYTPPKQEEIEEEKNFFPIGGYRTNRTAQNVAPMEKDSFGNFVPRTSEASYFNPNDGGISQVDSNALNYYGPEGTQPNFYGGGSSGNDGSAAYTPPPAGKGLFGMMMNQSNAQPNYYDDQKYAHLTGAFRRNAAQGGLMGFADGGLTRGPGDGMSDDIMTSISGQQAAALSPGEFVVPADVVSDMGNGDTGAGAKQLYSMMDRVRKARGGSIEQPGAINPNEYMPA